MSLFQTRKRPLIALVTLGAAAAFAPTHDARADDEDPPPQPNDFGIVFAVDGSDPPPIPANALDAAASFPLRAARLLQHSGCRPLVEPGDITFNPPTIFNSTLDTGKEAFAADALARLAYEGDCVNGDAPPGTATAAERYQTVDAILNQALIGDVSIGSDFNDKYGPFTVVRHGDLDAALKFIIPIVYLYRKKIPQSYDRLLNIMASALGSSTLKLDSPPTLRLDLGDLGSATVPETENHTLMILSGQYLTNQLLNDEGIKNFGDPWTTGPVHDYLMTMLRGILTSDFFEYNSKPYQHFALNAVQNLADFAHDRDVSTAATMVLDYAAAKFAVSSSLLRRSAPFRRRGSHDGNYLDDEQTCRFYLYSGQLQTVHKDGQYAVPSSCWQAVREVISTYRVPSTILDMAFAKDVPYFQTFSGGPSYFANMWGNDANSGNPVYGAVEIYDNEGLYLIASGGIPEPHGLPVELHGALVNLGNGLFGTGNGTNYSLSDSDLGVSLPTLLIPNDLDASSPIVDRTELVRIQGIGHDDQNLCVAPGFACGKNPVMPPTLNPTVDGPWQFALLKTFPVPTYVAMLTANVYSSPAQNAPLNAPDFPAYVAPYTLGLFEASPADLFSSFEDFQKKVKLANPNGAGLFVEHHGVVITNISDMTLSNPPCVPNYSCLVTTGWTGRYTKTDGTQLDIKIHAGPEKYPVESLNDYPITSPSSHLPDVDPAAWRFADGPISAAHDGLITISNPHYGSRCTLDIRDIHNPIRTCGDDLDRDGWPDADDNCPTAPNPLQENCNAEAELASQARGMATRVLGDACDPVPCPDFNVYSSGTTGAANHAPKCSPYNPNSGSLCLGRIIRDSIELTPTAAHPLTELARDTSATAVTVPAVPTDFRFCQANVALGFDCTAPQFLQDIQLRNGTSSALEQKRNPDWPWHRITVGTAATLGSANRDASGEQLDYGTTDALRKWAYQADYQFWSASGAIPAPSGYKTCTDASYGDGTCLDGRLWVHGETAVGNTVGSVGNRVVGTHGADLANVYLSIRPDDARTWLGMPAVPDSGLVNHIWIWQTLPDPGPDGDAIWRNLFEEQASVAVVAPAFSLSTLPSKAVALVENNLALDATPFLSQALVHSLGVASWISAAEPFGYASTPLSASLPLAVAPSPDGTSIMDAIYATPHGALLASEGATTSRSFGVASTGVSTLGPAARTGFATIYSRTLGGTFIVGGTDPISTSPIGDIWFQPLGGSWKAVPLKEHALTKVLAATYSTSDGQLWVLDQTASVDNQEVHLLRIDPITGIMNELAKWPRVGHFTSFFLTPDRDGSVLMAASKSGKPGGYILGRVGFASGVPFASVYGMAAGGLLTTPFLDDRGYSLVVASPDGKVTTRHLTALMDLPKDTLTACASFF